MRFGLGLIEGGIVLVREGFGGRRHGVGVEESKRGWKSKFERGQNVE